MAILQCGFFSVPHLLPHRASVYNGRLRGPVTLAPFAEQRLRSVSRSDPDLSRARSFLLKITGSICFPCFELRQKLKMFLKCTPFIDIFLLPTNCHLLGLSWPCATITVIETGHQLKWLSQLIISCLVVDYYFLPAYFLLILKN